MCNGTPALLIFLFTLASPAAPVEPQTKTINVSQTAPADHRTVQSAIDAIPDGNPEHISIHVLPGAYKEKIKIPRNKPFVTFRGDDPKTTFLTNDWNASHVGPE